MKVLLFLLLGCCSVTLAAPPVVSNVRASQMPGTQYVDIYYDLSDPDGGTMTVEVRVSSDGGLTYSVPASTLGGAVGSGVSLGTNKLVRWDAGTDFGGNFIERCRVRITAIDGSLPSAPAGMAVIPAGNFQMGDTVDGEATPTANIYIDQFYMDRTEVSKGLWDSVRLAAVASGFTDIAAGGSSSGALHPVHTITWYDAAKWCNARRIQDGLVPCYYTDTAQTLIYKTGNVDITAAMVKWNADGYRLPTESEWEKAARGGVSNRRFPWGTDTITHSQATYSSSATYNYDISPTRGYHPTYGNATAPCGTFSANGYGLYDMAGNLQEWTWDIQGSTFPPLGTPSTTNPTGVAGGAYRTKRGGSWDASTPNVRCGNRGAGIKDVPLSNIGFRSARR